MLPSANRFVPEVDVVSQFRLRGGLTDEEFENSLSHYFNEVWPGFNDRAHLFGGVGRVTIYRQQIEELLAAQSQVDLKKAVKKVFAGDVSYLDVVTQKPKFNHAQ